MSPQPEQLPAVPDDDVLEGEVVASPRHPVARVVRVVVVVVRHEHVKRGGKHVAYIPLGAVVVAKRVWESRTTARFERYIRAAELGGDREAMLQWEELRQKFMRDRHKRRMERRETTLEAFRAAPFIAGSSVGVLAAIGVFMAIAEKNIREVAVPFEATAHLVMWVILVVSVSWGPLVLAAPWIAMAALHQVGRKAAGTSAAPAWLRTSSDADVDMTVNEAAITQALAALGIPQITDYLKTGMAMPYIVPCREEGRGTYAEIRLPKGLPASELAKPVRRERFAAGLYRHAKEVWPSVGSDANHLKVWIADRGALEEGAGPYPLIAEGFTDVFKGLPIGRVLRGDPARMPVVGRNTMCGGMPEQGKSNAARVVAAGYTLDITTEMRIYVPDANFDFERFAPRCSRYVMGAEDEHLEQILGDLEELKDELQKRGQLLVDREQEEVTRELAHAGIGLHPMFVLVEEAHVAIQHRVFGKDISLLLCDIVKLDRKRGVHLMVSTQAPTKDSMPRDVTRNCSNGIAFAVGDHVANDALLGQGAYRGGHRATELIPGTDRGVALCKGFSGERSEMVQVHRLQGRGDNNEVTPIVERALTAMRGRPVPGTERGPRPIVSRDLLADLNTVLGSDRVRLADVPALLRDLAPSWPGYRVGTLNGVRLRDLLTAENVRTTKAGNVPYLDPADLRAVLARREAEGG